MKIQRSKLAARFVLNREGAPEVLTSPSSPGLKHYKIELFSQEVPLTARSVTYELHPTYYDALREVVRTSVSDEFVEPITSYGDYDVRLAVSGATGDVDRVRLTDALRRNYRDELRPDGVITKAIQDLEGK